MKKSLIALAVLALTGCAYVAQTPATDTSDTIEVWKKSVRQTERVFGHRAQGDPVAAANQTLAWTEAHFAASDIHVAWALELCASVQMGTADAVSKADRAVHLMEAQSPANPRELAHALELEALALERGHRAAEALPLADRALSIREQAFGMNDKRVWPALAAISNAYSELHEPDKARATSERLAKLLDLDIPQQEGGLGASQLPPDQQQRLKEASDLQHKASAQAVAGQKGAAWATYQEALDRCRGLEDELPQQLSILSEWIQRASALNDWPTAARVGTMAIKVEEKMHGPCQGRQATLMELRMAYQHIGQMDEVARIDELLVADARATGDTRLVEAQLWTASRTAYQARDYSRALVALQKSIQADQAPTASFEFLLEDYAMMIATLVNLDRSQEVPAYRDAMVAALRTHPPKQPSILRGPAYQADQRLQAAYRQAREQHNVAGARVLLESELALVTAVAGPQSPEAADVHRLMDLLDHPSAARPVPPPVTRYSPPQSPAAAPFRPTDYAGLPPGGYFLVLHDMQPGPREFQIPLQRGDVVPFAAMDLRSSSCQIHTRSNGLKLVAGQKLRIQADGREQYKNGLWTEAKLSIDDPAVREIMCSTIENRTVTLEDFQQAAGRALRYVPAR